MIVFTSILWKRSASIRVICSAISPDLKCSRSEGLKIKQCNQYYCGFVLLLLINELGYMKTCGLMAY